MLRVGPACLRVHSCSESQASREGSHEDGGLKQETLSFPCPQLRVSYTWSMLTVLGTLRTSYNTSANLGTKQNDAFQLLHDQNYLKIKSQQRKRQRYSKYKN